MGQIVKIYLGHYTSPPWAARLTASPTDPGLCHLPLPRRHRHAPLPPVPYVAYTTDIARSAR